MLGARSDQIDVAMAVPKAMLDDVPAVNLEPPRCHPLSLDPQSLSRCCHAAQSSELHITSGIKPHRITSKKTDELAGGGALVFSQRQEPGVCTINTSNAL